jgi:murein DD-endopeptidase MepM/ murein hydrolase activator NlpD
MPSYRTPRTLMLVLALAAAPLVAVPASASAALSGMGTLLASEYTWLAPVPATNDYGSGSLIWPTKGRLTQKYGCTGFWANPPYGSCKHFHNGIDIANVKWTKIKAARGGTVRFVGRESYGGAWTVVIGHGNGLRTWYVHMVATKVPGIAKGKTVKQGQLVGYMGKTGLATGVHLHFMTQLDGKWVNPGRYLP